MKISASACRRTAGRGTSAVLIHFSVSLTGAPVDKSERLAALELAGLFVVAAVIVWVEGRELGRPAPAS